jgi:hypothetical protein
MLRNMLFQGTAIRASLLATALAVLIVGEVLPVAISANQLDTCAIQTSGRIVAVGDVHGAYDGFVRILRSAGILDERDRWRGGTATLIQTGDVLDRGADSRRVLDLLRRLEREAPRQQGRVLALIGNHEVMRMAGDLRDASAGEVAAFASNTSLTLRNDIRERHVDAQRRQARAAGGEINESAIRAKFDASTPLGLIEMVSAFSVDGEYGRWLRTHAPVARVNGILFLHGGISSRVAPLGCEGINEGVRKELTTGWKEFLKAPLSALSGSEDGPLWYRGLAREDEAAFGPEVDKILAAVQARAIVVGHTPTEDGRIRPRFNGRVVQIDTGMLTSVYTFGRPSALEIDGDKWTAIYEDSRQPLR